MFQNVSMFIIESEQLCLDKVTVCHETIKATVRDNKSNYLDIDKSQTLSNNPDYSYKTWTTSPPVPFIQFLRSIINNPRFSVKYMDYNGNLIDGLPASLQSIVAPALA